MTAETVPASQYDAACEQLRDTLRLYLETTGKYWAARRALFWARALNVVLCLALIIALRHCS
jgi:hypothetical protein